MFGKRLKELRESLNVSRKELCEIFGIAVSTLAGYESCHREPDYLTLCRLADYFQVTTDYLLGRTDNKNNVLVEDNKKDNEEDKEMTRVIQELKDKGLNHRDIRKIVTAIKIIHEMKNI